MSSPKPLTLYYAPQSRAAVTLALLEELGVPYELVVLDFKTNATRDPAYLTVNPMGKVPAIRHGDTLVTEQVAIHLYLADAFPEAGLAPAIDDPARGTYLRWLVFYAACIEPAVLDRGFQRPPAQPRACPYGDFDTTYATILGAISPGPFILGERFSAVDIIWGKGLGWFTGWKMMPESPIISAYVERVLARPAMIRAAKRDDEFAASLATPA